ncbi:MAG: hypothetical protein PW843_15735 [Azospirillaceae bacterium]|nr:hypothetical protein [Azospirillaceae bacterium]
MRSIAGIFSVLLILGPFLAFAKEVPHLTDPVFGLKYDPAHVKFDEAPTSLMTRCPNLANDRWDNRLWIYGQQDEAGTQYLIVGGLYVEKATGRSKPNPIGAIIAVTPEKCDLVGPARETLQAPTDLPADMAPHLIDDLVRRYRTAFGGAPALNAALKAQHVDLTSHYDDTLRAALAK